METCNHLYINLVRKVEVRRQVSIAANIAFRILNKVIGSQGSQLVRCVDILVVIQWLAAYE